MKQVADQTEVHAVYSGAPAPWGAPYGAPQQGGGEEQPPASCDRDAIKLFLSSVPKTWDVAEIKKVLEEFGTVSLLTPSTICKLVIERSILLATCRGAVSGS